MHYFSLIDSPIWLLIIGLAIDAVACVLAANVIGFGLRSTYNGLLAVMALTLITIGVMALNSALHEPWASTLIIYILINLVPAWLAMYLDRRQNPQYYADLENLSLFGHDTKER